MLKQVFFTSSVCVELGQALFLHLVADQDGNQVHGKHEDNQEQPRTVLHRASLFDFGTGRCKHVHVVGQRHHRAPNALRQLRRIENSSGKHHGTGFARGTSHSQNGTGKDAGQSRGQHDAADRLALGGAQCKTRVAPGARHLLEGFFGCVDDHGQSKNSQCEDAGEQTYTAGSGVNVKSVTNPCVVDGQAVADWLLNIYKQRLNYDVKSRGNPALLLGDTITIYNAYDEPGKAVITNQKLSYNGGLSAQTEALGEAWE